MAPNITFQRILVPTDFGDAAIRAADTAAALAQRFGGAITMLHIWTFPTTYAAGFAVPMDGIEQAAKKALDDEVDRVRRITPKVEGIVLMGDPWELVVDTAKKYGADLVVMGTHGRRGLPRLWLGSVAERVVRMSPIPVLTIHDENSTSESGIAGETR